MIFTSPHYRLIVQINGVGVDLTKFYSHTDIEKKQLRKELGYSTDEFIITNVAEINKNKNQMLLVKTLPELLEYIPKLRILFIGKDNYPKVKIFVQKMKLESYVNFLGYRTDVDKLTAMSNLAFSANLREGLPVNIIEAMACGIPIVCSKNRGHNSLFIDDKKSDLLFEVNNSQEMIRCIVSLYENSDFAKKLAQESLQHFKRYSLDLAVAKMANIYRKFM